MRYGIVTLVVILLVIVGAVAIFGRGDSSSGSNTPTITKVNDYSDKPTASVSWTMQGRLVGDDQRKALRITINKDSRRIDVLDGYQERVEKTETLPNNEDAFESFTRALDGYGFGRTRKAVQADERGVCPTGYRYIFRVADGSKEVLRSWSSSCFSSDGTFGGGTTNASQIGELFKAQITDYYTFTTGLAL